MNNFKQVKIFTESSADILEYNINTWINTNVYTHYKIHRLTTHNGLLIIMLEYVCYQPYTYSNPKAQQ